jgi:hypothetical protein
MRDMAEESVERVQTGEGGGEWRGGWAGWCGYEWKGNGDGKRCLFKSDLDLDLV